MKKCNKCWSLKIITAEENLSKHIFLNFIN